MPLRGDGLQVQVQKGQVGSPPSVTQSPNESQHHQHCLQLLKRIPQGGKVANAASGRLGHNFAGQNEIGDWLCGSQELGVHLLHEQLHAAALHDALPQARHHRLGRPALCTTVN